MSELEKRHLGVRSLATLGLRTSAIQEARKPVDVNTQGQNKVHLTSAGVNLHEHSQLFNGKFCPSLGMGWVLSNDGSNAPHDESKATAKVYTVIIVGEKLSIGVHTIPFVKKLDSSAQVADISNKTIKENA